MDQADALKAAIDDLDKWLEDAEWGKYPLDRSTIPWEEATWGSFERYAKNKYGTADPAVKDGIKKKFDLWDRGRKFTAFD